MSVVIIGGNECMVREYKKLFTGTVSHKMVQNALREVKGLDTRVVRSHTSSMSALRNILENF
ncbi:MAG: DUF2325 domain-containing protein [Eubacteriales bacterium]|nr:DUF2325 domain-containing protein [Eubacteriales bacterium]